MWRFCNANAEIRIIGAYWEMGSTESARQLGLTRRQFKIYSAWFAGNTQESIARQYGMRQSRVSECINRALSNCPSLPRPKPSGRRRTLVMSQLNSGASTSGMNIDTVSFN